MLTVVNTTKVSKEELAKLIVSKVTEVQNLAVDVIGDIKPLIKKEIVENVYGIKDADIKEYEVLTDTFMSSIHFGPSFQDERCVIISDNFMRYPHYKKTAKIDAIMIEVIN